MGDTTMNISEKAVLARLGYAPGATVIDKETSALIAEEIAGAAALLEPREAVAHAPVVRPAAGTVSLAPGLVIKSDHIARLLAPCGEAYGLAVTIGPHLEAKRDRYLARRETTRALVLDAIGSVAAEALAEEAHARIRADAAARGLTATPRFSPGYGDWPVSAQADFLNWLGAAGIGIRLTPQFQMIPEKSVSALLGIRAQGAGRGEGHLL